MNVEYRKEFSHELNRDMEYKVFGHAGKACLVFPPQNGRFYDFEDFGMVDAAREYIDAGRLQLFCCDGIDGETWSAAGKSAEERLEQHERWFHYITEELVVRIKEMNAQANAGESWKLMTCGCSMGAFHALNFLIRRPDLFDKVLGMSGLYWAEYFFPDVQHELIRKNSSLTTLEESANDSALLKALRKCDIILSCGQGAWEQEMEDSAHKIKAVLEKKGVDAWIDFWGYDVSHDWYWWKKQIYYFLQFLL